MTELSDGAAGRVVGTFVGRDGRLRAVFRILLAVPLLLVPEVVVAAVAGTVGPLGMLGAGLVQAGAFGLLFLAWMRYIDRRRPADYGLAASPRWVGDAAVAFLAVVAAHALWYALGVALGWSEVSLVAAPTEMTFLGGLAAAAVAVALGVWVQDTVYFGVVLRSAAEGAAARGVTPRRAVLAGLVVAVAFVVAVHEGGLGRAAGLASAGLLYGVLYVHSADLALPIGFHAGVNLAGGWLFAPAAVAASRPAVFAVAGTVPGLDALTGPRIPQMVLAYLLVVGWLRWRDGGLGVVTSIAGREP